jgi:transcriptional regulator with XRE-family HTH domain
MVTPSLRPAMPLGASPHPGASAGGDRASRGASAREKSAVSAVRQNREMDSLRIGRSLRALRLRRSLRQDDVAGTAGLSRSQYARIERGEFRGVPLEDVEAACRALGADLDVRVRWHGEGLDRLLDAAHAELVDASVARLQALGWETAVEITFNHFGERGSIDVVGWHPVSRSILIVEVKSVVPDSQAMLSAHDRKVRLADIVAADRGWRPAFVGKLLVIAEATTARRRVAELRNIFDSTYPDRAAEVRAWLRAPAGRLAGLLFLPIDHRDGTRRGWRPRRAR